MRVRRPACLALMCAGPQRNCDEISFGQAIKGQRGLITLGPCFSWQYGQDGEGEMEREIREREDAIATASLQVMMQVGDEENMEKSSAGSMPHELQALIRLHLPISSCIKFASVCKEWYSTIASPAFTDEVAHLKQGKRPFLFLFGVHPRSQRSMSFHFDPVHGRWFRLPTAVLPTNTISASVDYELAGSSTQGPVVLYSSMSLRRPLHYALNPTCTEWHLIPPPPPSSGFYSSPILCTFAYGPASPHAFKILSLSSYNFVMVYDSTTFTWENVGHPSFDSSGSFVMSSALLRNKIFFVHISSRKIASFDVDSLEWTNVSMLTLPSAIYCFVASSDTNLFAVALCHAQGGNRLKLFKIDELSMEGEEVSVMPEELWHCFIKTPKVPWRRLKCVGSGKLVYVYHGSFLDDIHICMCDLEDYTWRQLPNLPSYSSVSRVKVACCSLQVMPTTCLRSEYSSDFVQTA